MQIGFIGLGHMGQHMARHVAEAGHEVAAFDVRSDAIAELTNTSGARRFVRLQEERAGVRLSLAPEAMDR